MTEDVKPASLSEIFGSATRSRRTATVCVAGELVDRFYQLEARLVRLTEESGEDSLADSNADARRSVALEMETLRAEIHSHEHTFTFERLDDKVWSDLTAEHPRREGKVELFNPSTFPLAACTACLVEVNGQPLDAGAADLFAELWHDRLNEGQRMQLFDAAWDANRGDNAVPLSEIASATLLSTGEK